MKSFWLFFPICFIISLVLWATKEDDFGVIFKRSFRTFVLLTVLIVIGCALIAVLGRAI